MTIDMDSKFENFKSRLHVIRKPHCFSFQNILLLIPEVSLCLTKWGTCTFVYVNYVLYKNGCFYILAVHVGSQPVSPSVIKFSWMIFRKSALHMNIEGRLMAKPPFGLWPTNLIKTSLATDLQRERLSCAMHSKVRGFVARWSADSISFMMCK